MILRYRANLKIILNLNYYFKLNVRFVTLSPVYKQPRMTLYDIFHLKEIGYLSD